MKVLLVEGSRFHQLLISQIFSNEGIIINVADHFDHALQLLEKSRYDFVCTAYHLPDGHTGIELAKVIRRSNTTNNIPVILLTSNKIDSSFDNAYDEGVTEIYNRSDVETLSRNLKQSIENKRNNINAHVLCVEDSKTAAAVLLGQLKKMNLTVEHFYTADEAFKIFKQEPGRFDIIITDILVAGELSGMGLVREVRRMISDRAQLPILVISGHDDVTRRIELLRMGANDYIVKPVIYEELHVRVKNLVVTRRLVEQVKEQQQELYRLAMTDQLTGLCNRHSLNQLLEEQLKSDKAKSLPMSLVVIDIDHFKKINDTYGHQKGDEVLKKMGQMISDNFRFRDYSARFGGEEFVVVMNNCPIERAMEKAEEFRILVEITNFSGLTVTISIGVSGTQGDENFDFDKHFIEADKALYDAKRGGRNRVVCYSPEKLEKTES